MWLTCDYLLLGQHIYTVQVVSVLCEYDTKINKLLYYKSTVDPEGVTQIEIDFNLNNGNDDYDYYNLSKDQIINCNRFLQ